MKPAAGMLGVLALAWAGLFSPRPVAASVMARRPGFRGAVQMVLFAYLVEAFFTAAVPGLRGPLDFGALVTLHVQSFGLKLFLFLATSWIATRFGRLVGGTGDFQRVAAAVGWGFVLQAMLAPAVAIALSTISPERVPPAAVLAVLAAGVIGLWLLAACIAEAHGFRSTVAVAAVLIGFSVAFLFVAGAVFMMSAFGGAWHV